MRRFLLLLLSFSVASAVIAQNEDNLPLYLQFPFVPSFTMVKAPDSTKFTNNDLKKKSPVIIMLFSPDCEHCQHETRELIRHMDLFKKVQIVMYSPLDYKYVKKFYADFGLAKYKNLTVGRDGTYLLGTFYRIHSFPGIFLYDKKKKFVQFFDGSVPVEKIAAAL